MKKKLSLLGLVLILIFSLAGCGKEAVTFDQAALEETASTIISTFSSMDDESLTTIQDLDEFELNYTLMYNGIDIDSDDFKDMIDAWKAGEEECGTILSIGEYTMTVSNSKPTLTAPITCDSRDGEIQFGFDEDSKLESVTINANYSTGEILKKAGLNTILGMGTVFVVLIFISFIISLFKLIPSIQEKFSKKKAAPAPAPKAAAPAPVAAPVNLTDDAELVAAIAAAIAAYEGTTTDGFIVRSIKRRKSNKWN